MTTDDHAGLIRRYIEAVWNEGNLNVIDELWVADRAAECRAAWASNRRFCPDGRFSIDDLIAQNGKVVACWTLRGTRSNGHHGSTARPLTLRGISVWTIQDGRLVDSHCQSEGPGVCE